MEPTGNSFSTMASVDDRVRAAVRSYGLQKQLASKLGMSDSNLSKFLDGQLPVFLRLLEVLDLEVVERGEISELKRVLKRYL
jgi:ribosome-binding protein aMBF1 (putative translation factor)